MLTAMLLVAWALAASTGLGCRDGGALAGEEVAESAAVTVADVPAPLLYSPLLAAIGELESVRDPKCHATAGRLEDFIAGTPLSPEARWAKNRALVGLAADVWRAASLRAASAGVRDVGRSHVEAAISQRIAGWDAPVDPRDARQYGSVAYALRATLAAAQLAALETGGLLPLGAAAVAPLKEALDAVALRVLAKADELARTDEAWRISARHLGQAWQAVMSDSLPQPEATGTPTAPPGSLLTSLASGKVASYEAYNEVTSTLFLRNLQVYFARRPWPAHEAEQRSFRQAFTETLIGVAIDLYRGAEQRALGRGAHLITEPDVHAELHALAPFEVDVNEDVVFFPHLQPTSRVPLEAYDLDAFRDSGVHWRYLQFALRDKNLAARKLDADPFAAELLAEGVAQLGVLILRIAGTATGERDAERLSTADLATAVERIRKQSANAAAAATNTPDSAAPLRSAPGGTPPSGDRWFTDVTASLGIDAVHRTSDWLNRQLRSYLDKGDGVGNTTIPPAFGGAGLAVGDVDGDGWEDLLILSGLGNRLYRNADGIRFEDITSKAGIDWRRPTDGRAGEPRQPLIADLDNDGHQDILITYVDDDHRLYRGLGDGRFEDVTPHAGLGGAGLTGGPATAVDIDDDGLLDLYITYFGDYPRGVLPTLARRNTNALPNRLFRNLGGLRFEDISTAAGVDDRGWGQAVTHTDLNGDGRQDLIVGNDFGTNRYYINKHGRTFEDLSASLGTDKPSYTMGFGIADLNDDLQPDIYVSNIVVMNKDEKYVAPSADTPMKMNPAKLATMRVSEANDLFVSTDGRYTLSQSVGRGYSATGWAWGADFADIDLDGDEDLYVLNGMNDFAVYSRANPYYADPDGQAVAGTEFAAPSRAANVLLLNDSGRLEDHSAASGLDLIGNSRSAVWFDYDQDGDLDVAVHGYHESLVVFRNDTPRADRHWLSVRLRGTPKLGTNRDAIGARVVLTLPDGRRLWRELRGSSGYMSVSSRSLHFGLGAHTRAELSIRWPGGREQLLPVPEVDRHLTVDQLLGD